MSGDLVSPVTVSFHIDKMLPTLACVIFLFLPFFFPSLFNNFKLKTLHSRAEKTNINNAVI